MPRMTKAQWEDLRADREGAGMSFGALEKKYGVSRQAISKRANTENWGDGQDGDILASRRARELTSGIVAGGNYQKRAESIETAAVGKAVVLRRQQQDWETHRDAFGPDLLLESVDEKPDERQRKFERLKCAKISAEMLKLRHEGERRAHNIVDEDIPKPSVNRGLADFYGTGAA